MKIPDPIMDPATSIVASVSVNALTNSRDDGAVSAVTVVVAKTLSLRCSVFRPLMASGTGAEVTLAQSFLLGNGPAPIQLESRGE
jgi:hypothetical protein